MGYITRKFSKYIMASEYYHISMGHEKYDEYELAHVYNEDDENYYGSYVEGIGAFDVRFPKKSCRPLTDDEIKQYSSGSFHIGSHSFELTPEELK